MNETWREIKGQIKEVKLLEYRKQLDIEEARFLEKELKSIVETTAEIGQSQTKIKRDVKEFSLWLNNNFGSSEKFIVFLNGLELHSDTDGELITFRNEYKKALPIEMNYRHYINWNNYTTYKKPVLIIAAFQTYYSNLPKRESVILIQKNKMSKTLKRTDCCWKPFEKPENMAKRLLKQEKTLKLRIKANIVWKFLILNGKKFRKGLITRFIKDGDRFRPITQQGTPKEVVEQYQFIHTYAFKQMGRHQLSSYKSEKEMLSMKNSRANRLQKMSNDKGIDLGIIKHFMRDKFGYQLFGNYTIDDRAMNKHITLLHKIFQRKFYVDFAEKIQSNHKDCKAIGEQFIEDMTKKLRTYKSVMR